MLAASSSPNAKGHPNLLTLIVPEVEIVTLDSSCQCVMANSIRSRLPNTRPKYHRQQNTSAAHAVTRCRAA